MSYGSLSLRDALNDRGRREGVKSPHVHKAGVKRWARHGLQKIERAEAKAEVLNLVEEIEAPASNVSAETPRLVPVIIKHRRGMRLVAADDLAVTMPSKNTLKGIVSRVRDRYLGIYQCKNTDADNLQEFMEARWVSSEFDHGRMYAY